MFARFALIALSTAFAIALGFISPARASDREEEFAKCHENATSTYEMHECMKAEYSYYDAKLNVVYQGIKKDNAGSDADSKEITRRVVEAQRTWIKYRDANCDYEATSMLNGTGEGLIRHGCTVRMTKERVKELESQR